MMRALYKWLFALIALVSFPTFSFANYYLIPTSSVLNGGLPGQYTFGAQVVDDQGNAFGFSVGFKKNVLSPHCVNGSYRCSGV
jgi:hypothetical protein